MLFLLLDLIIRNLVWSDESERPSLTTASQISLVRGAWNSFPGCSYSKHHTAHTSFSVTYASLNATTNQGCMYSIIKAACQTCATYNYVHVQGLVLPPFSSSSSFSAATYHLSSSPSSSLSLFPDHCGSCSEVSLGPWIGTLPLPLICVFHTILNSGWAWGLRTTCPNFPHELSPPGPVSGPFKRFGIFCNCMIIQENLRTAVRSLLRLASDLRS